jgi:hypothetical protein
MKKAIWLVLAAGLYVFDCLVIFKISDTGLAVVSFLWLIAAIALTAIVLYFLVKLAKKQ